MTNFPGVSGTFEAQPKRYLIHRGNMVASITNDFDLDPGEGWEDTDAEGHAAFVDEIEDLRLDLELQARTAIYDQKVADLVASGLPEAAAKVLVGTHPRENPVLVEAFARRGKHLGGDRNA